MPLLSCFSGGGKPRRVCAVLAVSPTATGPAWQGWGTSLAWFAHALGHDAGTRDAICELLFGKEPHGQLGLNIVRYNIGGANQEHAHEYRPGAAVPCFANPDGSRDWSVDAGQVAMLLKAAELGADVFEAFVNSPPWHMTVSGTSRGHKLPLKNNLAKERIQEFAEFCADVVQHFESAHSITFTSLSPFNEPGSPAWCLAVNCKQEACFFSKRRSHKVLAVLQEVAGLRGTQLVAFEQFCVRDTLHDLQHLPKQLRPAVARVNCHTYTSATFFHKAAKPLVLLQDNAWARRRLRQLLQRWDNTPLWISEFGTGRGALQLAKQIVMDCATLLPAAWVYWQAVEDVGSGWGLLERPITHPQQPGGAAGSGGGQAAVSEGGEAGSTGDSPAAAIVLHPNFWVLQFLVRAVPVGSRLCQVKGFGSRGFGVQLPSQRWRLVYLNASASTEELLQVDISSCCGVGGAAVAVQVLDVGGLQPETAAVGGKAPAACKACKGVALTADGSTRLECAVPPGHLVAISL